MSAETLVRAIETAIANGWTFAQLRPNSLFDAVPPHNSEIIYNHGFAKALWGSEYIPDQWYATANGDDYHTANPAWQVHLSHMVIADDPLAYLAEHLPEMKQ